jgi:hypothetical protein
MAHDGRAVLLLLLLPIGQVVQLFTLVLALYLTVIELRGWKPHWKWWIWWLLFVALTHLFGYLALRGYVALRHRHRARA